MTKAAIIHSSVDLKRPVLEDMDTKQIGVNSADGKIFIRQKNSTTDKLVEFADDARVDNIENRVEQNEVDISTLQINLSDVKTNYATNEQLGGYVSKKSLVDDIISNKDDFKLNGIINQDLSGYVTKDTITDEVSLRTYTKNQIDQIFTDISAGGRVSTGGMTSEATFTLKSGETKNIRTYADASGHNLISLKEFVESPANYTNTKWDFDTTDTNLWDYDPNTVEIYQGKIRLKGEYSGREVVDIRSYNNSSYALMDDGSLMVCGYNVGFNLGISGNNVNQSNWVPSDITDVAEILDVSLYSVYVKKTDGTIYYSGSWRWLRAVNEHLNTSHSDSDFYVYEWDEHFDTRHKVQYSGGDVPSLLYKDYSTYGPDYSKGEYVWDKNVFITSTDMNSWNYWAPDEEVVKLRVESRENTSVFAYCLTNKGNLYFTGLQRFSPITGGIYGANEPIPSWVKVRENVKDFDITGYSVNVVDNDGKVYCTGNNKITSSFDGNVLNDEYPLSTYYDDLYGYGKNSGMHYECQGWVPLKINNCVAVASGLAHVVYSLSDGSLLTIGNNKFGQCLVGATTIGSAGNNVDVRYSYNGGSAGRINEFYGTRVPTEEIYQNVDKVECKDWSTIVYSGGTRYIAGRMLHRDYDAFSFVGEEIPLEYKYYFGESRDTRFITFMGHDASLNQNEINNFQVIGNNIYGGFGNGYTNNSKVTVYSDTKNRFLELGSVSYQTGKVVVKSFSPISLTNIVSFGGITAVDHEPEQSNVKYAFSLDRGQSWFDHLGEVLDWDNHGSTTEELSLIQISDTDVQMASTLDVAVIMESETSLTTPSVDQISVNLVTEGSWKSIGVTDGVEVMDDGIDSFNVTNTSGVDKTFKAIIETRIATAALSSDSTTEAVTASTSLDENGDMIVGAGNLV